MWNANQNYTKEELEIVRELEGDLFRADPGFRSMWRDDFEGYFKGTLDEDYWQKRERERHEEIRQSVRRRMIEDPSYASWRHELAATEDTIFSSHSDPVLSRGRRFEQSRTDEDYERPDYEKDQLYRLAKQWSRALSQKAYQLYEETKLLPAFRIAINAPYVTSKIVFASGPVWEEAGIDLEWRTDRIGYTLSLSCLERCLQSFGEIERSGYIYEPLDVPKFQKEGDQIRQELIDRLEEIEQTRFKKLIK